MKATCFILASFDHKKVQSLPLRLLTHKPFFSSLVLSLFFIVVFWFLYLFFYGKAFQVALWSIWVSGFLLIALSLYAMQSLPSLEDHIKMPKQLHQGFANLTSPKITIFSAPDPLNAPPGPRQVLAVRSWLALSPYITVVLFSRDPSVVVFARAFGSRVSVEPNIDFT